MTGPCLPVLCATGCLVGSLAVPAVADAAPAITVTRAKALAKAGVLTSADVPGLTRVRQQGSATDADVERVARCIGIDPNYVASAEREYGKGARFVASEANVARSVARAKADMRAFRSARFPRCVKEGNKAVFEGLGGRLKSMSVTKVPVTVAGANSAVAYKVVTVAELDGRQLRTDDYRILARVGQTEIAMSPGTLDGSAPGLRKWVTLTGVLAKRVRNV